MSPLHQKRDAFLRVLVGTGVMARDVERRLIAKRRSGAELTVTQEDHLRRATRTVNDVNRIARELGRLGVDARVPDLAKLPWPDSAKSAEFTLLLLHIRDDFKPDRYDFRALDLTTMDLNKLDVRKFEPDDYRV